MLRAGSAGVSGGKGRVCAAAGYSSGILAQRRLNRKNYPHAHHQLLNTAELPCHFVVGIFFRMIKSAEEPPLA